MKNAHRQPSFSFPKRGGARTGSGRKRVAERELVPHRARPKLSGRHPLHVTLRVVPGVLVTELLDPCSSAAVFDGWKEVEAPRASSTWLARARTWLLTIGWRRHGLLSIRELPRAGPR